MIDDKKNDNELENLFITPEDYIFCKQASTVKEIVVHIDKKCYSMWANPNQNQKIKNIASILSDYMKKFSIKYKDLPYDYIFTIATMEAINEIIEENEFMKNNLSSLKMKSDYIKINGVDDKIKEEKIIIPNLFSTISETQSKDIEDETSKVKNEMIKQFIEILEDIESKII